MKSSNPWRCRSFPTNMNKKLFCVLTAICGLILFSMITRDGKPLLLAMPFLAYLFIGTIQAPTGLTLVARRKIEKTSAVAGEPVQCKVTVTNQGQSLVNIDLRDSRFPSQTILEGQTEKRIWMPAGQTMELNYVFKAGRGVYPWESIQAAASDSFGLFEVRQAIPAPEELVLRPASMSLDHVPLRPRFTLHTPGPIPVRLSGSSTDFLGIREYRAGDSLRRLNWRMAARHPHELFSNEYEREEIADFGLILDARQLTNSDPVEEALFEHSVRAAVALSETLLKGGNRLSLLVFGNAMASLFPGYGKRQLKRILWTLARARLGSNLSLGYLKYFPTRLFPSRSFLIVLSPLGLQDQETYARLRSFGYEILLISPDPVHSISQEIPSNRVNDLAVRAARVERVIALERLMKIGVQVIDWRVTEPFESVLQRATRTLAQRKNV